jgi:hypothetical protein
MEVSTPTRVPINTEQEPVHKPDKADNKKSLKGNKLGVFAKIFEGLTQNLNQGEAAGEMHAVNAVMFTEIDGDGNKENVLAMQNINAGMELATLIRADLSEQQEDEGVFPEAASLLAAHFVNVDNIPEETPENNTPLPENPVNRDAGERISLLSDDKPAFFSEEAPEIKPGEAAKAELGQNTGEIDERNVRTAAASESRRVDGINPADEEKNEARLSAADVTPNADDDNEDNSRLADVRSRRRERNGIEVRDLRTPETALQQDQSQQFRVTETRAGATVELTVDLSTGNKSREEVFRVIEHRPSAFQSFEELLARELNQNLSSNIVRQAQVVLRDHGAGTIKLALKPESLGNIKIRLEMSENKVIGHIIVESVEALRAFEKELAHLQQAFKDSGFEGAHLDMSLAGGNEENNQGGDQNLFLSERFAASMYDAAADEVGGTFLYGGDGSPQINMLA